MVNVIHPQLQQLVVHVHVMLPTRMALLSMYSLFPSFLVFAFERWFTCLSPNSCSTCATNYYNYPTCSYCNDSSTCGGPIRGSCDRTNGQCICNTKYTQSAAGANDCNGCQLNYFGSSCSACLGGVTPSTVCYGRGACDWGASGSGACICTPPYRGLDCSDPTVTDISPLHGPNSGGTYVVVNGRLFGSTGSGFVTIGPGGSGGTKVPIFSWNQNQIVLQTG